METTRATATGTMKAVRIHDYGDVDVLQYEDAPRPTPGAGEVLVRVYAAGVNPIDWKVREGYGKERRNLPLILGWDFSGVIEAAGPQTTHFKAGHEVFGRPDPLRDGAYAQYLVAREVELGFKPRSLDHIQSGGLALAGLTAWQSLFDAAGLDRGQSVLIHAAAGGVGHLAVQLAKWKGAHVIATCSKENFDFVRNLGADDTIDYSATPFENLVHNLDVVFDTIGGQTQQRSWQTLKRGGILVSIVQPPSQQEAAARGVRQALVLARPDAEQLAQLAALADDGKLAPFVQTVLPLSEARKAHELSKSGHVRGKIVLRVE